GLDNLAMSAALMQNRVGRHWRPLGDTVNQPIFMDRRPVWPSWQRGSDYYLEGQLIWLDVDTRIRELTSGKRSLDDFVQTFFSVRDRSFQPFPYDLKDIVRELSAVAPYDWAAYFRERVESLSPQAPLDGLMRGGYRLMYSDHPTEFFNNA